MSEEMVTPEPTTSRSLIRATWMRIHELPSLVKIIVAILVVVAAVQISRQISGNRAGAQGQSTKSTVTCDAACLNQRILSSASQEGRRTAP
jgi:hypothetical protein